MCDWLAGLQIAEHGIVCMGPALAASLALWVALAVGLVCMAWMVLRARGLLERLAAALVMLAAVLLAVAAGLPGLQPKAQDTSTGRIAVLVDLSESVRRNGDGALDDTRRAVADQLRALVADQPRGSDWRGAVLGFGARPRVLAGDVALFDLASSLVGADPGPVAGQSDLAAAIEAAVQDIQGSAGTGMIVLISDGLPTTGDTMRAVQTARRAGIAIHVAGVGSTAPSRGLLSHDIGPQQAIGRPATLRLTVQGNGALDWGINGKPQPVAEIAAPDAPRAVRIPVTFPERGLNFVDMAYRIGERAGRAAHAYTLVQGPARILTFGPAPWLDGADPTRFLIERADPRDDIAVASFDAVVIDALSPSDFAPDMPQRLLDAAAAGTGLFIENGPLRGGREDMQRLSDWEETVLGPVLPVNSDPAEYLSQPPKRDVMIIIDTSGSMKEYIEVARAAAHKVIDSLRPEDSLVIVPFDDNASPNFEAARATANAARRAKDFVDRLGTSGGTNMTAAITRARQLRGNNCALFIIGDGGYPAGQIQGSPICFTTAIGVAGMRLPGIDTEWGEQHPIRTIQQLGPIEFKAFKPEPRTEFWATGPLATIPVEDTSPFAIVPPVSGAALSYPRPEASGLIIMADPPRAPVLAFRHDPKVRSLRTGAFLGVVPQGLPAGPDGWASRVLEELVGWDDPDRFDIRFDLDGERVDLRIIPLGDAPVPDTIAASLLMADGQTAGISTGAPDGRGIFKGQGRIGLSNKPMRGTLNLELGGGEVQSIPVVLPARRDGESGRSTSSEAFGYGIDRVLLDEIAHATGGLDIIETRPTISRSPAVLRIIPVWPYLAALAVLIFAGSLFLGGARR